MKFLGFKIKIPSEILFLVRNDQSGHEDAGLQRNNAK